MFDTDFPYTCTYIDMSVERLQLRERERKKRVSVARATAPVSGPGGRRLHQHARTEGIRPHPPTTRPLGHGLDAAWTRLGRRRSTSSAIPRFLLRYPTGAMSDDLVDFEVIENQKENIQALPSGRSARALAQLYTPPLSSAGGHTPSPGQLQDAHSSKRAEFDRELATVDEADDPLDVYDRYVKWTLDTYPSAQNTPQSQLCPLLERATRAFQSSPHYRNDPRYLKLWLHYIRLFSDAPRETFAYLARHHIGDKLALYYEEFAAWLETAGRWSQADEVYAMGIDNDARPRDRLVRKYAEFQHRCDARPAQNLEPTSPALPKLRPALAAKLDPFAAPPTEPQPRARPSPAPASSKSGKPKLAVFADTDEPAKLDAGGPAKGWDSIGSLADRRKENTSEPRPWAGETLKVGKKNAGVQKMAIFKDEVSNTTPP